MNSFDKLIGGPVSEKEKLGCQMDLVRREGETELEKEMKDWFDALVDQPSDASLDKTALRSTRRQLGYARYPVAAICFVVAAIVAGISTFTFIQFQKSTPESQWAEMVVPQGETANITLEDGTSLVLNSGSRITYPDHFAGKERKIFLDGEVLASVAHNPQKPFRIVSGKLLVEVKGTVFDFKSYAREEMAELMLLEGCVKLSADDQNASEVVMRPGDLAQFSKSSGAISLTHFNTSICKSFDQAGYCHYLDLPLCDIAADLERRFGAKVVVADSELAKSRFYAYFINNEGLDDILAALNSDGRMTISRSDDAIILSAK